jgi:pimeloyl-ACP methyl ester carboxylesterase
MKRRAPEVAEISVYDRMCWPEGQLLAALRTGAHGRELAAYLGPAEYSLLQPLARAAARARRRSSLPRVYLLPGIMGSQLGSARTHGLPPDLLWLDPTDIVRGRLSELRWGENPRLTSLGGIIYSYLALKLRLQARGFDVTVYDYDWRCDLRTLGAALAARLHADGNERLALVGHSMGGLLARAALAHCAADAATARRIARIIGLGTPHGGSIAAVQALRATYPVVFRLAAVDRRHDARHLSRHVFGTFTSLYQLLPDEAGGIDLFDPDAWPGRGVRPHLAQLAATRGWRTDIAPADERFASIIGTGQRTVTGLERRGGQFRYEISSAGDGTVATGRATLPGARNYYLRCEHSELPRSELVASALTDLLRTGRTRRLPQRVFAGRRQPVYVTDAELRRSLSRKVDWQQLTTAERRRYFARLNLPPPLYWPQPR